MPYEVGWLIESRVVMARIHGDVIEADGIDMLYEMARLIDSGHAPVHILIDTLDITRVPKNLMPLVQAISEVGISRERTGYMMVLSNNQLHNFIGAVAAKMAGVRLRTVDDRAVALEFLRIHEPELNDEFVRLIEDCCGAAA